MDRVHHRKATVGGSVVALAVLSSMAFAEHDHSAPARAEDESRVVAHVGALAASYRSRLFEGDYQGVIAGAAYTRGRFEVGAHGAVYQIDRNGKTYRGFGDVTVHGAATVIERGALAAGAHLMVMVPSGDAMRGLGMGHWMFMPAAWAAWSPSRFAVSGSIGYARGIGAASAHAEHGGGSAWPLVDPMSFSEVTFDALAMIELAGELRAGVRMLGALPLDDDARAIGAAHVTWRSGRIETTAEAQAGLAGDPVRFRGLVSTAMRF